jgi:hypothetical protein
MDYFNYNHPTSRYLEKYYRHRYEIYKSPLPDIVITAAQKPRINRNEDCFSPEEIKKSFEELNCPLTCFTSALNKMKADLDDLTKNEIMVNGFREHKKSEETKKTHKCHCDMRTLMAYGCKCGGV